MNEWVNACMNENNEWELNTWVQKWKDGLINKSVIEQQTNAQINKLTNEETNETK